MCRAVGRGTAILLVACGGAAGAVARFLVGDSFSRRFGTGWPYGTLFINVTGCFAIALFLSAAESRAEMSAGWRYLFPVGFVGAYTTFSTYGYEAHRLIHSHSPTTRQSPATPAGGAAGTRRTTSKDADTALPRCRLAGHSRQAERP